jgi:hypothetical protein
LTPITAIKLTDPADAANTHTTKFVNNEAYQLELGGELGPELWAEADAQYFGGQEDSLLNNPDFGAYLVKTDGSGTGIAIPSSVASLAANTTYYVKLNITEYVAGDLNFSDFVGLSITGVGEVSFFVTASSDRSIYLKRGSSSTSTNIRFNSVSLKAIPASTFLRENEEPDGSDIVDITRKPDNSGWTGDGLDYDYANGALPE